MAKLTLEQVKEKFRTIKLLALDVDGVLTNDAIYFGPDGFEMKKFNTSDGLFMVIAMRSGLELAIVSGRNSKATDTRMKDLGVKHVLQGMKDKTGMLAPLLKELDIKFDEVAFVGNEILDIKLAKDSGLSIAVADSCQELLDTVDFVTEKKGGQGAVREIIEIYFKAINLDPKSYLV
jgi:3-deoxy-D-manno-octulosonate 8-phosphate phosphatase (KDO 8-P phosphatase)